MIRIWKCISQNNKYTIFNKYRVTHGNLVFLRWPGTPWLRGRVGPKTGNIHRYIQCSVFKGKWPPLFAVRCVWFFYFKSPAYDGKQRTLDELKNPSTWRPVTIKAWQRCMVENEPHLPDIIVRTYYRLPVTNKG